MAVPYELVVLVFAVAVLALLGAWRRAPSLAARSGRPAGKAARAATRIRVVSLAVLALVVAGAAGLHAVGAPVAPDDRPLAYGGAIGGNDPRLLAASSANGRQLVYAYAPGAEIRTGIVLANRGPVSVTVTGIAGPASPWVRSLGLRLPPDPLTDELVAAWPQDGARWASEPFRPFEIPPRSSVGLALTVTLGECPGATSVPTLAPGATLLPDDDPRLGVRFTAVDAIQLQYSAFGIARTATVALPMALAVAASPRNVYGCGAP